MKVTTLQPHIRVEGDSQPLLLSAAAHLILLVAVTLGSGLWRSGFELHPGNGKYAAASSGSPIPLSLSGELTGGAGNVAPPPVPVPEAARPRPPRPAPEKAVEIPKFEDPNRKVIEESPDAPAPPPPEYAPDPSAGTIPGVARPGIGGRSGEAAGLGTGLQIGAGPGGPGVAGWYIRQLEQRIARNWLRASLGSVSEQVLTRIGFTIARSGLIEDIHLLESSGHSGVDRAAERAIRASSPLPPLPVELRGRRVEFVAHFAYPPR